VKAWQHATRPASCGGCGAVIPRGTPTLVIAGPGWKKLRCADCAGEPVPADIDGQRTVTTTIGPRFAERLAGVRALAQDFKHAQAGDRR